MLLWLGYGAALVAATKPKDGELPNAGGAAIKKKEKKKKKKEAVIANENTKRHTGKSEQTLKETIRESVF